MPVGFKNIRRPFKVNYEKLAAMTQHMPHTQTAVAVLGSIPRHGKLLVFELVLPIGDEPFFGKWLDLHMLVMASGCERTEKEYSNLLQNAGFELTRFLLILPGVKRPVWPLET